MPITPTLNDTIIAKYISVEAEVIDRLMSIATKYTLDTGSPEFYRSNIKGLADRIFICLPPFC